MTTFEILIIGVGLAMDAFAIAICKGLSLKNITFQKVVIVGLYFGIFQGLMPLIGFILGISFQEIITKIDHYIAFIFLGIIGINMIKESLNKEQTTTSASINFKNMFPLALATSIDALAIGITFAFLKVNIFLSSAIITITTLIISSIGVILGYKFGNKYEKKSEFIGGLILILIGLKILLEHLNII